MFIPAGFTTATINPRLFDGRKWTDRLAAQDPPVAVGDFWINGTTLVYKEGLEAPTAADKPDPLKSDHNTAAEGRLLGLERRRARLIAKGKGTARVDSRIAELDAELDAAVDDLP